MNTVLQTKEKLLEVAHDLTHELIWGAVGLFVLYLFKSTLEEIVMGILWRFRSDFNNRDIVKLDNEWSRIIHIGLTRTEFTVFLIKDGSIIGGDTVFISNEKLREHQVKKPLSLAEMPKELRQIER